jgi:two-component system, sensor histidine kinase
VKPISLPSGFLSSIRAKLIGVFVLIKLIPLVVLALFAWWAAQQLGANVTERSGDMAREMFATIKAAGRMATDDAQRALDDRSREAIESLTTETARAVAGFLYDRDQDILQAARQEPSEAAYRNFLAGHRRELFAHGPWVLSEDGKHWQPAPTEGAATAPAADSGATLAENTRDFHARPPEDLGNSEMRPLYAEMTLIGLDGRELLKLTSGGPARPRLADIRDRRQTFARAENYWPELQNLKSGEVYVSEVIGTYVGSHVIGPYLPETAAKAGIPFAPDESAYAGAENPVGRRFRGIVRWATPVEKAGKRIGYVTLALDHDHLRQFIDRIVPTPERYTSIADASGGNYAFMWDHKHRAIAHPRDYFIVGYNAETGRPETPWMDQSLYEAWQASGKPSDEFLAGTPSFHEPSLEKRPLARWSRPARWGWIAAISTLLRNARASSSLPKMAAPAPSSSSGTACGSSPRRRRFPTTPANTERSGAALVM